MNKFDNFKLKNAKYLEKLGFEYYEDDGFSEFLKAENVPNKLNTEYIKFKKISFYRLEREINISSYKKSADCTELLEKEHNIDFVSLNSEEIKALFKILDELGWNKC
jgi:hypothetical protein